VASNLQKPYNSGGGGRCGRGCGGGGDAASHCGGGEGGRRSRPLKARGATLFASVPFSRVTDALPSFPPDPSARPSRVLPAMPAKVLFIPSFSRLILKGCGISPASNSSLYHASSSFSLCWSHLIALSCSVASRETKRGGRAFSACSRPKLTRVPPSPVLPLPAVVLQSFVRPRTVAQRRRHSKRSQCEGAEDNLIPYSLDNHSERGCFFAAAKISPELGREKEREKGERERRHV